MCLHCLGAARFLMDSQLTCMHYRSNKHTCPFYPPTSTLPTYATPHSTHPAHLCHIPFYPPTPTPPIYATSHSTHLHPPHPLIPHPILPTYTHPAHLCHTPPNSSVVSEPHRAPHLSKGECVLVGETRFVQVLGHHSWDRDGRAGLGPH